ncbi:MATE family efflux transporter [Inquilinus limosus]|uniref:Multidrug transporter MatE n=1 Tax=Inquilinus limosus MP06 TaxID=1398085 RepID=A0A0A0CVJ8_9PROT|nr:MATE family efflux transporter [Inquilinus limosus]KGM30456.1 multidrug transporter MatE [Inquilinus limosus MP06]
MSDATDRDAAASPATARTAPAAPALWKAFLLFLGPMMLSNVLQALSGTVNNIYLGQMIGVGAVAAVSAFFPILFFFISFIIGLGAGASVLIGQAWGAREPDKVKAVAGTTLTVTILAGIVVALFGGAFTRPLLVAVGTPPDILADSTEYARIMLIAMPGLFVFILVTSMMRGVGDTVTPLLVLALQIVIGLVLTPALIRGWGGLPQLGVLSGAYAAIVSFLASLVWLSFHLRRRGHALAPDAVLLRHLWIDPRILRSVLRIGLPSGVQLVLVSLAEVAVLSLVNGFGSDATAAYGAVNQVISYVQFPAISIAITASIFGAQAIGAGHADRLGAITRTGLLLNLAVTGGLVAICTLLSRTLMGLFLTSEPVIELAQDLLHITLWSYIVFGIAGVIAAVMRASGTVLAPTAISLFAILGVEVPVAWLLSRQIGIDGVWIAYPVAFIVMALGQIAFYRLVWSKRAIRRMI